MRIPTISQMVDENTIAYYPLDGNLNDACGSYNLSIRSSGDTIWWTDIGHYSGGGEAKAVASSRYLYNSSLGSFINSNACTIDLAFNWISPQNYNVPSLLNAGSGNSTYNLVVTSSEGKFGASFNTLHNLNNSGPSVPFSQIYNNGYHHFALIRNSNVSFSFFLDGKNLGTYSWSYGVTMSNFNFSDGMYYHQFDIMYIRVSKGIRWTEDFIGGTPIDDLFYTVKEKDNDAYGLIS